MTGVVGRAAAVVATWALVGSASACSGDSEAAPGEQVPGLARKLERIDAAVVDGRYDRARAAIGALAAQAARARVAGELSAEETERILDAAQALVEQLPEDEEGSARRSTTGRAGAQSGS